MGRCKQKQSGLRGLLCRWPSITEWEMHITAQGPPVSEMTYTVSSGTLNPSIPYHTVCNHRPATRIDCLAYHFRYLPGWNNSALQSLPNTDLTSCRQAAATICLRPLQVDNIFVFISQVAVLFRHNNIFIFIRQVDPVPACWLFKTSATS